MSSAWPVEALIEIAALRSRAEQAEEHLQTTFQQVAGVARLLDPEVCPDAWGLHAAAQKTLALLSLATSERDDALKRRGEYLARAERAEADNAALLERRRALEEALRSIEWGGTDCRTDKACCPACGAIEGSPHTGDCRVANALKRKA